MPPHAPNRLAREKSPYLIQHKDNPVDWHPWGAEAFDLAKSGNKPVFLSIGYSTCHWCHVMAHESFENPEVAAVMNEYFINIKVDREERPDVDRLYMAFVQATTGGGGWPMSVWLTPDGKPFFGGTYFPPQDRFGRPGFVTVLERIAELWARERERVVEQSERVTEALRDASAGGGDGQVPGFGALTTGFEAFANSYDAEHGGFGGAPKFPRPSVFNFLLRIHAHGDGRRSAQALEMTLQTLRQMAAGGIHDHLGGGFHRYAVDERWHVPHFEKMLYDQAQLAASYVDAWQITKSAEFADAARGILGYVDRALSHPSGGFFSAEDADSLFAHGKPEHGEGAFYVWTQEEIVALLGADDAAIFNRHYGVEPGGNAAAGSDPHGEFTGRNILARRVPAAIEESEDEVRAILERCRAALFAAREQRPRPHLDDKILTAWNGLMISAFAKAGAVLGEPAFVARAEKAARFLRTEMADPQSGELLRSWREGPGNVRGFAEDYAFLIQGLLDLYEADLEAGWLEWALALQQKQDALFRDPESGVYFGSAGDDPLVPVRMKDDSDGAEPSANAISALNLLRLGAMLHDEAFSHAAEKILAAFAAPLTGAPAAVPQMLTALDTALAPPRQIVIAGEKSDPAVAAFARKIRETFHPNQVILLADGDEGQRLLARTSGAIAAMRPINGKPALYVCENFTCQPPITDPEAFTP